MLHVFRAYLALILGKYEDKNIHKRLWEDFMVDELVGLSDSTVNKYLKREIVRDIERLTRINGFYRVSWGNYKNENVIKNLETIKLDRIAGNASFSKNDR